MTTETQAGSPGTRSGDYQMLYYLLRSPLSEVGRKTDTTLLLETTLTLSEGQEIITTYAHPERGDTTALCRAGRIITRAILSCQVFL